MTTEQLVRALLDRAVKDGLVRLVARPEGALRPQDAPPAALLGCVQTVDDWMRERWEDEGNPYERTGE